MEASQTPGTAPAEGTQPAAAPDAPAPPVSDAENAGTSDAGTSDAGNPASEDAAPPAEDAEAAQGAGPAVDQAPVATERGNAIVGDSGLYEQQPESGFNDQDTPVRTSAPPPSLQSGVPLPEDRAAGVQPGE